MTEDEIKEYIEKVFPYQEQSTIIFALTAFFELLKYQKDKINNKVIWECYIKGIERLFKENIEELLK